MYRYWKQPLCILLFFTSCVSAMKETARTGGNDPDDHTLVAEKNYSQAEMDALKKTTSVFLYTKKDLPQLENIKKAITDAWTFTPVVFAPMEDAQKYNEEDYSFFVTSVYRTSVVDEYRRTKYANSQFYLSLQSYYYVQNKNKTERRAKGFCRIELYPNPDLLIKSIKGNLNDVMFAASQKASFKNDYPGLLKVYLKAVNADLVKNKRMFLFTSHKNESELAKLRKDTLLVPDYVLVKMNKFNGNESLVEAKELFGNYPYPYKIVPVEELSELLLTANKPYYLFDYVKSSTDKFVTIYNTESGEMVYRKYVPLSYQVKDKDIKAVFSK